MGHKVHIFILIKIYEAGIALILFIKNISDLTSVRVWKNETKDMAGRNKPIPAGTTVYEINGPMFFADADKFGDFSFEEGTKVMILRMSNVPSIDATAMKKLELLFALCQEKEIRLILSHVNTQPMEIIKKSGFYDTLGGENFAVNIDVALELAAELCQA